MKLSLKAPAKINLGLSIVGKGLNNYHEVKTIYTQISLFDLIELEDINEERIEIMCNWPEIPVDRKNLIWKAASLVKDKYKIKKGLRIKLLKKIPVGTGLGGGSSDAASVLKGLNTLWQLNLDKKKLVEIGKKIGADVAYHVEGGVKLEIQGGDKAGKFSDLGRLPKCYIVIGLINKTRISKQAYQEIDYTQINKNDLSKLIKAIENKDFKLIGENLYNDFENWTCKHYPEVKEIKKQMIEGGAVGALMSGKGLTVFSIFNNRRKAKAVLERLKTDDNKVYLVVPYYED
ncbi:MAG: 4-(cytidine 5'-diphospho)-2-C-methyl-D-erythritol kinase [Candidatus Beckwithbacteria bacterium]